MSAPVTCGFCNQPAAWRWKPPALGQPVSYNQYLCDDHAVSVDLDELEDLSGVTA
jgi:hypothetical protein